MNTSTERAWNPIATREVQLIQYIGTGGGFDTKKPHTRYKVQIIGINGTIKMADESEPYGWAEEGYAKEQAQHWSDFLGWPIVRYEEKQTVVRELVRPT